MGKYHNILYVALKLCFDWNLKKTDTVTKLLKEIYLCEKTFERLLVGAIFGFRAPHYIAGWKSDFISPEENFRAVIYFLHHATAGKLKLDDDGPLRFVDVPIESCGRSSPLILCVQLGLPDKLHFFLRFGATIQMCSTPENGISVVEHLLIRLTEFLRCYPYNLVCCLQLLLRCIPSIQLQKYKVAHDEENAQKNVVTEYYAELVEDGLIPLGRSGFRPPELKHLSRCVIRDKLYQNFKLPTGISELPIPLSLRKYVDILED